MFYKCFEIFSSLRNNEVKSFPRHAVKWKGEKGKKKKRQEAILQRQNSLLSKITDSTTRLAGFGYSICHLVAVWRQRVFTTISYNSFLICMKVKLVLTSLGDLKDQISHYTGNNSNNSCYYFVTKSAFIVCRVA